MIDGPRDVPMVTNAYGVRYPAHTDDHPTYTIDAKYACNAATYGGDHTCSCVYRKTVCDGSEHLCMCGSSWTDKRACYCPELHHHEKETPVFDKPNTVPVKVTVSVEVDGHVHDRTLYVQQLNPADKIGTASAVREMIRYSATETAKAYAAPTSPHSDDLFAAQTPEPKRSCCSSDDEGPEF